MKISRKPVDIININIFIALFKLITIKSIENEYYQDSASVEIWYRVQCRFS